MAKKNRNRNRTQIAQPAAGQQQGGQIVGAQFAISSPIPPSAELENYERILPGLANRIITQFEAEGSHRRDMESRNLNLQRTGLALGTVLFILWILESLVVIETGHSVEGTVSGLAAITALIANTVIGYRRRHN